MSIQSIIRDRYSSRSYKDQPIEPEKVEQLLAAVRLAPTAANRQPICVYAVESKEGLDRLSKAAKTYGCPLAMVICADKDAAWTRPYDNFRTTDVDASIVTDEMMLLATELGLGSVWICMFDPQIVREAFDIPENLVPVNILALGYAADEPAADRLENRKPTQDLVRRV